jgi:hypothetical protein
MMIGARASLRGRAGHSESYRGRGGHRDGRACSRTSVRSRAPGKRRTRTGFNLNSLEVASLRLSESQCKRFTIRFKACCQRPQPEWAVSIFKLVLRGRFPTGRAVTRTPCRASI